MDLREIVAGRMSFLKPGEIGLDDLPVTCQAENQRDVHADTCGDRLGDCLKSFNCCGDLDHRVLASDLCPELLCLSDGSCSIVRKSRLNLDRNPTVTPRCCVVYGTEDVAGGSYVIRSDLEHGISNSGALSGKSGDLLVIGFALG